MRVTTPGQIRVHHYDRIPHYKALVHEALTTIWDPEAGLRIHLTSMTISVEGAGSLLLQYDDTEFATLLFGEKKTVPINAGGDITLPTDAILKATFTADTETDKAYVTAFGHEDP
ncbi:hypothetical protein ES708_17944 [subsurface metagenome]